MSSVALFLLSQVFLIIHHKPLVRQLASLLLAADSELSPPALNDSDLHPRVPKFIAPVILLTEDFVHTEKRLSQSVFYSTAPAGSVPTQQPGMSAAPVAVHMVRTGVSCDRVVYIVRRAYNMVDYHSKFGLFLFHLP